MQLRRVTLKRIHTTFYKVKWPQQINHVVETDRVATQHQCAEKVADDMVCEVN